MVTHLVVEVFFNFKRNIMIFYLNVSTKEPAKKKQIFRSHRSQMLFNLGVFKNFANITGKRLVWSLFLDSKKGVSL